MILRIKQTVLFLPIVLAATVIVAQTNERVPKLEKDGYHGDIEEVIITGQKPEWRQQEKPTWRPNTVTLPDAESGDVRFMPEYTKDERDTIPTPEERKFQRPEMKLFEWRF